MSQVPCAMFCVQSPVSCFVCPDAYILYVVSGVLCPESFVSCQLLALLYRKQTLALNGRVIRVKGLTFRVATFDMYRGLQIAYNFCPRSLNWTPEMRAFRHDRNKQVLHCHFIVYAHMLCPGHDQMSPG